MAMNQDVQLKVTFFPPLYLQRRIWVLDVLRREQVTEIIDIGCGEGQLLAVLCQPAPSLPPPDNCPTPSPTDTPALEDADLDLHPTHISGLDISPHALTSAIQDTSPTTANTSYTRWEPLKVDIWHGGLEIYNPAFVNKECIVATEVIEHLPEGILADFAPMLMGAYHPRLLLLTTPSYTFNARFSPPGSTNTSTGFPDPTNRTTRVFRHHDHKFEFTIEEFGVWCEGVGREWGYEVDVSTIGRAVEKDEWGRDEGLGGASQVAVFRRVEGGEWGRIREQKSASLKTISNEHRLLETHHYPTHPLSGKRASSSEIEKAILAKFEEWDEDKLRLEEIWFGEEIGGMCGGWFEVLIEVIEGSAMFELERSKEQRRGDWSVVLVDAPNRTKTKKKTSESRWAQSQSQSPSDQFSELETPQDDQSQSDPGFDWGSGLYSSDPDSGVDHDLLWDVGKYDGAWGRESRSGWTCDSEDDVVDWGIGRWSTLSAAWDGDGLDESGRKS